MEEALDEDEDEDNDVGAGVGGEKMVLDEKTVLPDAPASIAVDIPLGGKGERLEDASGDVVGAVGSWMSSRSSVTHTDDRG
jgi:hypothetical protein